MEPFVALVSLPWADAAEPSLGLAVLKSQLSREGIRSRVFHSYLKLLTHITYETYKFVSAEWGLNDFLFTGTLQPDLSESQYSALFDICERCADSHSRYQNPLDIAEMVLKLRNDVIPRFLESCCDEILRERPTLVGMTCMFDQTIASVALARCLKDRRPDLTVALGGYALEGPPGDIVLQSFPWIDCVARGDGEGMIGALAFASAGDAESRPEIPGVTWGRRQIPEKLHSINLKGSPENENPPIRINLEDSPEPNYEDWFREIRELMENHQVEVITTILPVEGSRGCWWGQKKHCVFCGIDDKTLVYRSKLPTTIMSMLQNMREQYGDFKFRFSDYIMPISLYNALPALAEAEPKYRLVSEIKANQTASRLAALGAAGFVELQPGIESFSTPILRLMDKGVSAITNVATIKNGFVNRIIIHYNILYGIPGELPEHYYAMLSMLPRLYHLTPPVSRTETFVTRFAPLHADPERFGHAVKPRRHPCYSIVFSEEFVREVNFDLDDYAYYFETYFDIDEDLRTLHSQLVTQINYWKQQHTEREVYLQYHCHPAGIDFWDTRYGEEIVIKLSSVCRDVYAAADDDPKAISSIASELKLPEVEVQNALQELDAHRLIWIEGNSVFGVATPRSISQNHLASKWHKTWPAIWC